MTDYDEETQAAIRKIMVPPLLVATGGVNKCPVLLTLLQPVPTQFDQRQKAQGLPTSEELLLARAGMPPASAATPPHPPQPS